jgi:cyclic beta-1,2-glucan synthetase
MIEDHARWLIAGETVLILRGPIENLRVPMASLLESGEIPPAVFVLHPRREYTFQEQDTPHLDEASLSSAQLTEYARSLAASHRLDSRSPRSAELLDRLERSRRWTQQACLDLTEAVPLLQSAPPSAEWLLDNEYVLESNARDVRMNLPRKYYRQLPTVLSGSAQSLPRVYELARELTACVGLRLDEENILAFVDAYQSVSPLSIGELWAIPQMLRMTLIESIGRLAGRALTELREEEIAGFWANRLITVNRRDPNQLFAVMAELTADYPSPSPFFARQLMDCLYDEDTLLTPVKAWLERVLQKSPDKLAMRVKNGQMKDLMSIDKAFTSLRQLALLDWKECFERLSLVERTLCKDSAGVYPRMDFATRDRYRGAVEDLRRGSGLEESLIAQRAINLAVQADQNMVTTETSTEDERATHVGTYLIGEGRSKLAQLIGCRETWRFRSLHWAYRHHSAVFFLGLAFFCTAFMVLALRLGLGAHLPGVQLAIVALLLLPVSQLALDVMNFLITRLFPPRALPKMDFKKQGIPDACRTLVVVPMMLTNRATIANEVEKLEIRYLANKEANLLFALYSDYKDAAEIHGDADAGLLEAAREGIEVLNRRYGGERFFLLHRERKWCESEQKFIGWERKRGKLEELNDLIAGTRPADAGRLVYVGNPDRLTHVRFVITLDSDTQLPTHAARRMIETLAHPLNRAQLDDAGIVRSGYAIIQPRVSPSLPSASGSPFSRLFSDPVGIDPYANAISDVYQDLAGEGSYHGKGIYDVRIFSQVLTGRFPDAWLLSHDLIEGAHVRVGLASDIELYDEFPQDYLSYAKRQHRWIRGDWQIADWILPRVPRSGGGHSPNPLTWFNRWKILDNLRRSLLPVANLALLVVAWLVSLQVGWVASLVVAVQMLFHLLMRPFTWATTEQRFKKIAPPKIAHDLLRVIVEAALLPYQAWLALDAIGRVFYRRCISHQGLLEWAPAQAMHAKSQARMSKLVLLMSLASAFGLLVGWAVKSWRPAAFWVAVPWFALWFFSPLVAWLLSRRPVAEQPQSLLPEEDRRFLRIIARYTWRYFTDFVSAKTSWLPPDNYQVSHQNQLAMRTSPTNIGLYLVSVLSAHDFGYLTVDEVTQKLMRTMETVGTLERHEGHLLNWYDIATQEPLKPHYVSSVDSGNLLGALWALDRGLESLMHAPLLDAQAFTGLHDAGEILRRAAQEKGSSSATAPPWDLRGLNEIMAAWDSPPDGAVDALTLLRRTEGDIRELAQKAGAEASGGTNVTYWAGQIQDQQSAWLSVANRYLGWIEVLNEKTGEEIAALNPDAAPDFLEALCRTPSLKDLADGNVSVIARLQDLRGKMPERESPLIGWIDRVLEAFGRSQWLAGEMLDAIKHVAQSCRELSESINMRFLYNEERRLFSIGFNVSEGRLDRAFYDLLASEARLGSFVAIARGDVPAEHWFAMTRPYGAIGRRRALLSWTGTMFEYLMPLLFQRSYGNALLDKATREAVAIQIDYGRKHRVPWGISECAFGDLDIHKTYQYQAFGVPELGLKRGLADKLVVAPYATLLALGIAPPEAVQNLKRLAGLGLLNDYGFYEALDYSHQPSHPSDPGVIVRAYMAHHQGMSFLALANFLHHDCLRDAFHADQRVRTVEPLLYERIPELPPLHHVSTRERVSSVAAIGEAVPSVSQFETPHSATPKTQLLSNGRYSLMLTSGGGGYSRWGGFDLTRWRADATCDAWGTFFYVHDVDANRLWCNSYHPTGGKIEQFSVNFTLDRAEFRRVDHDVECETEIIVVPEDDAEIRRMTLINRSERVRHLELTSYIELAMARHGADLQHPAFNKLFIQTEALSEECALLASRRPRSDDETPIFVAHRLTMEPDGDKSMDEPATEVLRFQTNRLRFIGRGRSLAYPMGALQEPEGNQGFVLDPILSLRQSLVLEPGQRARVSLVLVAASSREQAVGLMNKYGDSHAIHRAMDLAWTSAQLELRLLRVQPDEVRCFQELASHLLYPNLRMRSASHRIAENRRGQSGLWAYAISGDLPIALVIIGENRDLGLVRQMLQAHAYWRMHGFATDLVILNEEEVGYTQPLREKLERLIQAHGTDAGLDRPGGIYLCNASLIPPEDLTLLRAVASVVLVAARGALPQQLAASTIEAPVLPEPMPRRRDPRDPSAALPFMDLLFFNSLGGFTPDEKEYAIYLGPGIHTPAPWVNIMANPSFGALVSETGAGFTWRGNSQRNRLTQWSNDPVLDPTSEAIYIRDEETGIYWTPTASPIREETPYRARHGAGYTIFEHNSHGMEQELTVFVPVGDAGGDPVKLQRLWLRNDSRRPRRLSLTYYVEWTLGENRESSQMHTVTDWDDEAQAMLALNHYNPDNPGWVAFAAVKAPGNVPTTSYTGDRAIFLGRNRSLASPAAMERVRLARRIGAGLDPCGAVQVVIKLAPGERVEIAFMLGQAQTAEESAALVKRYQSPSALEDALRRTQAWWDDRLGTIQVHTPELAADILLNRWLLYQTLACRVWGRSGFYQSGGAIGFRDQLQDVMALLYADPGLARTHILLAAAHQFEEGDVQHWWHPPGGAGIRSHISDDLLWLPFVTAQYVRVTGDSAILCEVVPLLQAPLLDEGQHECFQSPVVSSERATLFEHCRRALAHAGRFGEHGLPLMGTGDWNDGMNLVGAGGKGESVWLAWFMAEVMQGMAEMAGLVDQPELGGLWLRERKALVQCVEKFAWDGEWYLRATFDDGTPLGSSANEEARIDSLPQSWAWLGAAADKARAEQALESAWNHLVREDDGLVLLFEPPFERSEPSPGYIKGYPPGVRENGGQYTHAAIWLAMAMAQRGDGVRAATILRILNPIEHAREPESVWRYGVEPYVVAADVYNLPGRIGQGGWSWYTGSAAWMYRAWVEEILGLKLHGETMHIDPVIPGWWDGFQMTYRHGEAVYEIQVDNPDHCEHGVAWVEMDGERIKDGVLPLTRDLVKHRILVRMGEGALSNQGPM